MPKCNPRCPVVKQQLRNLAAEAPWLLEDEDGDPQAAVGVKRLVGDDSVGRKTAGVGGAKLTTMKDQQSGTYGTAEKATLKQLAGGQMDSAGGIDRVDRAHGMGRVDGVDRVDRAGGVDRVDRGEGVDRMDRCGQEVGLDTRELLQDECEENCPRRISRKSRIQKLEEAQCIVDTYLLNKGVRYFDDVCTCSLSCVLRALKRDPFVTSTIASIAIFSIGVKLCSELNAWYLPVRFS